MAQKRIFTEEEIKTMIDLYNEGETYAYIAGIVKTKAAKVSKILNDLGYGRRKLNTLKNCEYLSASRKNSVDETYFESIDTINKAYWLGFIFADGCVMKKHDSKGNEKGGVLEIALKQDDEYHLINFLKDIKSDERIERRTITLGDKKHESCRVKINSVKIVNDLISLGCVPNKSLILEPPKKVPEELVSHFVRGYFDGDGCVGIYPSYNSKIYSILGTHEMLEYIMSVSGVTGGSIRSFEHKQCFELRFNSKDDIEMFHNYIYNNASIFLERKYIKSLGTMKYFFLEDGRTETQKMTDLLGDKLFYDFWNEDIELL